MRSALSLAALVALSPLLSPAPAAADEVEEISPAERQLQLAREDFAKGDYTRAVQACESALRLDSGLKEAFKIKGLALEQLGERDDARAMLKAYETLASGLPPDPEVVAALERLEAPAVNPIPIVFLGAGSGLAVAGFVMHGTAFQAGKEFTDAPQPVARLPEYEALYDRNVAGLALGVAGAALAGAGAGLLVASLIDGPDAFSGRLMPSLSAGPGGIAVGLHGRW